jgi:hypothetical protein
MNNATPTTETYNRDARDSAMISVCETLATIRDQFPDTWDKITDALIPSWQRSIENGLNAYRHQMNLI